MKTHLLLLGALLYSASALATENEFDLVIRDHRFEPAEITVPAGKKVRLKVENKDSTPEEFHSDDLNREKVMLGNSSATIIIGPLKPGRYKFMGEFHESTAQGVVIAK